ncbi:unnamed protein product, partial [Phaeothamnion confervicola]
PGNDSRSDDEILDEVGDVISDRKNEASELYGSVDSSAAAAGGRRRARPTPGLLSFMTPVTEVGTLEERSCYTRASDRTSSHRSGSRRSHGRGTSGGDGGGGGNGNCSAGSGSSGGNGGGGPEWNRVEVVVPDPPAVSAGRSFIKAQRAQPPAMVAEINATAAGSTAMAALFRTCSGAVASMQRPTIAAPVQSGNGGGSAGDPSFTDRGSDRGNNCGGAGG